ncbi:hypothetical protein LCGC14_2669650 [marine sediment metagenome]|uniref:Uncharacterized protein n=1 Tax=marine sediment metagenome TaxID=412755 RepID=A0A0F8ZPE7_9ZZZZ
MAGVIRASHPGNTYLHTWQLSTSDATGDSINHPGASDRTIQFVANTAGGAIVIMEGSHDGSTWFTLTDGQGNAISFTDSGGEMIAENMLFYRPRLSVGGSGADWTVLLFSRSTMR